MNERTIFVDLDGTLIYSDLLLESFLGLVSKNFFYIFMVPFWLSRGRAFLKDQIASRVELNVALLPYNTSLIEYLEKLQKNGSRLVLISASNQKYVNQIAQHLGIFENSIGSSQSCNLKGSNKLKKIRELCGEEEFSYAGNESADLKIWSDAASAIIVNGGRNLKKEALNLTTVEAEFDQVENRFLVFIKAIRVHQWVKNGLLFVPLVLSHQIFKIELVAITLTGFVAFGLCASSVYLLNDLLDLENDRQHPTKCKRPFAKGILPLSYGLIGSPALLLLAYLLAWQTNSYFLAVMSLYYISTVLYSFKLKSLIIIDVLVLAGLFTIRIIAGAALSLLQPTFWLLAFSMFLFFSLAIVKRVTELGKLSRESSSEAKGRGYVAGDFPILSAMGSVSGIISVLVFSLYINDEQTREMYAIPEILWLICPLLLYLISRIWLIAHRGKLDDDPIVFVIKDRNSQIVAMICGILLWLAA